MEFGIKKCAVLVIEKGKTVKSVGIELPDGKVIKSWQEVENYKYLGILEADRFLGEEIKLKVFKEYFSLEVLKSKLNGKNLVQGVSAWVVSLLKYLTAFISWRKWELQVIDRKTRTLDDCTQNLMLTDCIYLENMVEEIWQLQKTV